MNVVGGGSSSVSVLGGSPGTVSVIIYRRRFEDALEYAIGYDAGEREASGNVVYATPWFADGLKVNRGVFPGVLVFFVRNP